MHGVYPFNPDAIDCSVSVTNLGASLQQVHANSEAEIQDVDANWENQCQCILSTSLLLDKLALFQQQFSEGHDFPDEEYMTWLKENHPETFTDIYGSEVVSMSIADAFSDVPVASGVMIDGSELKENVSDETENEVQNSPTATDDTKCPCSSGCDDSQVSAMPSNKEVETSSQKSSDNDAQGSSTTATSSKGNGDKLRYISNTKQRDCCENLRSQSFD